MTFKTFISGGHTSAESAPIENHKNALAAQDIKNRYVGNQLQ